MITAWFLLCLSVIVGSRNTRVYEDVEVLDDIVTVKNIDDKLKDVLANSDDKLKDVLDNSDASALNVEIDESEINSDYFAQRSVVAAEGPAMSSRTESHSPDQAETVYYHTVNGKISMFINN